MAAGELALEKHDYALAAKEFEHAAKLDPKNAEYQFGLARAFAPSDPERAEAAVNSALEANPFHVPTLLFVADRQIDAEQYAEASAMLVRALAVNPESAEAWAYAAVVAHLLSKPEEEGLYRRIALGWWPLNPLVDHLIGRKLSQNYRFHEAETYQRRALSMDPNYLPAKVQLSNDLLRLGKDEGWQLADEVSKQDGYNVVAHNLVQLQERLAQFRTLERAPFQVRMDAKEAEIYGERMLDLLSEASETLVPKYKAKLPETVIVEIFPAQQDFAVRTFGMPGGEGFLGVCFGPLITANSPAALGGTKTNWQSVLWHEFCHVVTLTKTENKMPRWFSEGISVFEERQHDPAWGESLTPLYREMLTEEVTPISKLSSAFMHPKTPMHLQLAYYEASLVIEFLIERYGFDCIVRILDDLALGISMDEALTRHAAALEVLDQQFGEYVKQRVGAYGSQVDWTKPEAAEVQDPVSMLKWLVDHPDSFFGRQQYAQLLLKQKRWGEAKEIAQKLREQCPEYVGADNAYQILAVAHAGLNETEEERAVLEELATRNDEAIDVYERLTELAQQAGDWPAMRRNSLRAIAVNPLRVGVQQHLADAAEKLGNPAEAATAYRAPLPSSRSTWPMFITVWPRHFWQVEK